MSGSAENGILVFGEIWGKCFFGLFSENVQNSEDCTKCVEKVGKTKENGAKYLFLPRFLDWWEEVDSNHRSRRRQIYSLIHLAALESSLI